MSEGNGKKVEDWEVVDHIADIKSGMEDAGVCSQHGSLGRALIYILRHNVTKRDLDEAIKRIVNGDNGNSSWKVRLAWQWFNRAPYAVVGLAAIGAWTYAQYKGWL